MSDAIKKDTQVWGCIFRCVFAFLGVVFFVIWAFRLSPCQLEFGVFLLPCDTFHESHFCICLLSIKFLFHPSKKKKKNSWNPAIIICSKGSRKYLVEYLTLEKRCRNGTPQGSFLILLNPEFEEVKARYNNAWWVGSFSKVI